MRGEVEESQADRYPSFEEWKGMAAQCDETAHLAAGERKPDHPSSWWILIASRRLLLAISIRRRLRTGLGRHWSAVRSSARSGARTGATCPGFLDCTRNRAKDPRRCTRLAASDALDRRPLLSKTRRPRAGSMPSSSRSEAIRARFARWNTPTTATRSGSSRCPSPYPAFEDWRREADSYVDVDD